MRDKRRRKHARLSDFPCKVNPDYATLSGLSSRSKFEAPGIVLRSYIDPAENREASRKLPRLMVEGLLLGGTGLGVLALIFEIAADAFSVAAYQTLLAIHGRQQPPRHRDSGL